MNYRSKRFPPVLPVLIALWLLQVSGPGSVWSQTLTLDEALRRADSMGYANRAAVGAAAAERGRALGALRAILPSIRLEAGYLRTTDPLNAFGLLLRQRAVTTTAFDPASLNRPDVADNYAAGVVIEQPLVNLDAWYGRRAASVAADALAEQAVWVRESTRYQVIAAYFGAVLQAQLVRTLEVALAAARRHESQAKSLVANGVVTQSDALLASVRVGEVESRYLAAQGERDIALRRLGLLLGNPDSNVVVPDSLPPPEWVREGVTGADPGVGGERSDVTSALLAARASRLNRQRAGTGFLPRLNGFARWDWQDRGTPFGGDRSWTVGLLASWSLFGGGQEVADLKMARGTEAVSTARADALRAQAEVDRRDAENRLEVALSQLAIAEVSVRQSAEAHRIVGRKYEGELATVVELLDAEAGETRARLGLAEAAYAVIVAEAGRRLATGLAFDPLITLGTFR